MPGPDDSRIRDAARSDPAIHLFTNLTGVGNVEVNAFQRLSNVVIQKSLREGFGLVVSEALWKGTPVVAGRAGGIPLQLQPDVGGFLVDSVEECAERTRWLLQHPEDGAVLAAKGRERVRERFLLTRLIADELRLYAAVLGPRAAATAPLARVGLAGEVRDLVCGMRVDPANAPRLEHQRERYYFCSDACRALFEATPARYLRAGGD